MSLFSAVYPPSSAIEVRPNYAAGLKVATSFKPRVNYAAGLKMEALFKPRVNYAAGIQVINATAQQRAVQGLKQAKVVELKEEGPFFGPLVFSANDAVSNLSGLIRSGFSGSNVILGTENPAVLAAMGVTTTFSAVGGAVNFSGGIDDLITAKKTDDLFSGVLAAIKTVKGGALIVGGMIYLPVRACALGAIAFGSSALRSASSLLGKVGDQFFRFATVLTTISLSLRIYELMTFRKGLKQAVDQGRGLEFLKESISLSEEEKQNIGKESAELKQKVDQLQAKALKKKEASFSRVVSPGMIKVIREAEMGKTEEVVKAVFAKNRDRVVLAGLFLALCLLSLSTLAITFAFTGAVPMALSAVIGTCVAAGFLVLEGIQLIKDLNESETGKHDGKWLVFSMGVAFFSLALVVLLSSALLPIIVMSLFVAFYIGIKMAALVKVLH
jgi:hypothetical protein